MKIARKNLENYPEALKTLETYRIAIMEGGRIIQFGTAQEIILNPANDYVADFVGDINFIEGVVGLTTKD